MLGFLVSWNLIYPTTMQLHLTALAEEEAGQRAGAGAGAEAEAEAEAGAGAGKALGIRIGAEVEVEAAAEKGKGMAGKQFVVVLHQKPEDLIEVDLGADLLAREISLLKASGVGTDAVLLHLLSAVLRTAGQKVQVLLRQGKEFMQPNERKRLKAMIQKPET